jgi:hypothetical protein
MALPDRLEQDLRRRQPVVEPSRRVHAGRWKFLRRRQNRFQYELSDSY